MRSINFKVVGLSRPGLENVRSGFDPATFRFPDLPARDVLLIWPLQAVDILVSVSMLYYPLYAVVQEVGLA